MASATLAGVHLYGMNLELSTLHTGHIFGGAGPSCIYPQTRHCHRFCFCI